jgi:putative Holliday junction resolvase
LKVSVSPGHRQAELDFGSCLLGNWALYCAIWLLRGVFLRSLGLDVGDKRIGIALSDPLGMLARPLSVLERSEDSADIEIILKLVTQQQAGMIIVGIPLSMDGGIGTQAQKVQLFAEKLKFASAVPLQYRDERLSTVDAKRLLEAGRKKKSHFVKKGAYDAAAAAVILQSYLNETIPMAYPFVEHE